MWRSPDTIFSCAYLIKELVAGPESYSKDSGHFCYSPGVGLAIWGIHKEAALPQA